MLLLYNTGMFSRVNPRVIWTLASALIILGGTALAIQYARGNFRITSQGVVRGAGLLSANSAPTGAQVIINGKLVTATDDTIYLDPGTYDVSIVKDGYSPWRKQLTLQSELVTQTNAQLFPIAPSLSPLTFTGIENALPSPDGQKLLFYTASASASNKKGLYVMELSNSPLSLQRGARQIAEDVDGIDLRKTEFIWAPDSSQVLAIFPHESTDDRAVLLDISSKNDLRILPDISYKLRQTLSEWEEEMYIRERQYLGNFPPEVIAVATQSAKNVYLSPDKKKLLYTATASAVLDTELVPPLPATNSQPESRTLEPNTIYVYDREEDRNFKLGVDRSNTFGKQLLATDLASKVAKTLEASPSAFVSMQASSSAETVARFRRYHTPLYAQTFQWLADSQHLVYYTNDTIRVVEYDGGNDTVLYSGPFEQSFVYPWPDGSKLMILTTFSPESPTNLYAIELK